jgi:predicted GNAT family N-acyltransferase
MIEIKNISPEQTYDIRLEVLRKGIDLPVQFSGDNDSETFHLGVFENTRLVGISSFMKTNNSHFGTKQYQLRGMATISETRGKGYGKALLKYAIEMLKDKKMTILWCNAREVALEFYLKLGFKIKGESFDIPKIGIHYVLYKEL